jgi:hypothetical protein
MTNDRIVWPICHLSFVICHPGEPKASPGIAHHEENL